MKMKLCSVVTSLSGLCLAASSSQQQHQHHHHAHVYDLLSRSSLTTTVPHLPRQLAGHILLQRATGGDDHSSFFDDLPEDIDKERAVSYLNEFGREPMGIFDAEPRRSSMVLLVEGVTEENSREMRKKLGAASFTITDPPSADANKRLASGVASKCDDFSKCREGLFVLDVAQANARVEALIEHRTDALIVLVPETSRASTATVWTEQTDLRRRQFFDEESVMTDAEESQPPKKQADKQRQQSQHFAADAMAQKRIPSCFPSEAACTNSTNSCSGHGKCVNRFAIEGSKIVCFRCACVATKNDVGSPTRWAGKTCSKKDVSIEFWLIAGLTVALIGMVSMAVGMLFSVGEEKLPGVIGAGVSRAGK